MFLHSEIGNAGYVWLAVTGTLYFSSDAGGHPNAISGVSSVSLLGIGKSNQIYIYGIVTGQNSGNPGYFTTTNRGGTWTLRGSDTSVPVDQSVRRPVVLCGDYNIADRFYVAYDSSGAAIYNP
jgi:hypothetical protein